MRVVWKYPIPTRDRSRHPQEVITTHVGARPLLVAEFPIGGDLPRLEAYCWIEVDSDNPVGGLSLWFIGTGKKVPDGVQHLQSLVSPTGHVWHIYWSVE